MQIKIIPESKIDHYNEHEFFYCATANKLIKPYTKIEKQDMATNCQILYGKIAHEYPCVSIPTKTQCYDCNRITSQMKFLAKINHVDFRLINLHRKEY